MLWTSHQAHLTNGDRDEIRKKGSGQQALDIGLIRGRNGSEHRQLHLRSIAIEEAAAGLVRDLALGVIGTEARTVEIVSSDERGTREKAKRRSGIGAIGLELRLEKRVGNRGEDGQRAATVATTKLPCEIERPCSASLCGSTGIRLMLSSEIVTSIAK